MSKQLNLFLVFQTVLLPAIGGSPYGYGIYGYGLYGYGQMGLSQGMIQCGPGIPRVKWSGITVIPATTSTTLSQFACYRNGLSVGCLVASTLNGNNDNLDLAIPDLTNGEFIVGVWSGGDSGAIATLTVSGTKVVPGNDDS